MISTERAVLYTFAAAFAVFFCRAFPFLVIPPGDSGAERFGGDPGQDRAGRSGRKSILKKVLFAAEKTAPPVAMTVLAVNGVVAPLRGGFRGAGLAGLAAAAFTLCLQLWRRNYLLSIAGGTAAYMILLRAVF